MQCERRGQPVRVQHRRFKLSPRLEALCCNVITCPYKSRARPLYLMSSRGACYPILSVVTSLTLALSYGSTSCGFNAPLIDVMSKSCKLDVLDSEDLLTLSMNLIYFRVIKNLWFAKFVNDVHVSQVNRWRTTSGHAVRADRRPPPGNIWSSNYIRLPPLSPKRTKPQLKDRRTVITHCVEWRTKPISHPSRYQIIGRFQILTNTVSRT
ncbi:hypothetical protein EV424DRAFT_117096 [Suillus variegatus]|nr:hypothetical protein EV424DRAFT_117096 [Suillus variegatus]